MSSTDTERGGRGRRRGRGHNAEATAEPERRTMPGYLRYDAIPGPFADSLRTLINRYELRNGKTLPEAIVVTSALHGEGTTQVSQALATLLAREFGQFVCWVDCSWLTGTSKSNQDAVGMVEMLQDHSKILSAFQSSSELPKLTCLRPGSAPSDMRHTIVRSPEFERLVEILVEEFDHVIFDAPPLLGSGDGLALLRRADSYVLAVRQRSTAESQVRQAIELASPQANIGVALTNYRSKVPSVIRHLLED